MSNAENPREVPSATGSSHPDKAADQAPPAPTAPQRGELVALDPASAPLGPTTQRPIEMVTAGLDRLVADVIGLLAAIVSRLRTPLGLLALAPVVAGVALVVVSALRGGPDVPFAIALAVIGVTPGGWLAVRRHQLLHALQPPGVAAAEISAALAPAGVWAQVKANLLSLPTGGGVRPGSLAKKMWRGIKLGAGLRSRLASIPRLAPFMPGRLRGAALLGAWCAGSAAVLAALTVVKALTALVGIG